MILKIYILPVPSDLQSENIPIIYPSHNKNFRDGEEDFLSFLHTNPELLTNDPDEAHWHYLPVFWNRWLVSHNFGRKGLSELRAKVNTVIIDDGITFTIYEYAGQPAINLGKTIVFLGSRTDEGLDFPLLCAPHQIKCIKKKYRACFVGKLSTHFIRKELKNLNNVFMSKSKGTEYFVQKIQESYIALSPRGYGGASFRFYEAMQMGVVPYLIGDIDHRPFKNYINWNEISLYSYDMSDVQFKLDTFTNEQLLVMGAKAKAVYEKELANGNWCQYILKTLMEKT